MVAIVSGNSLGLNLTSKGVLGDGGVQGEASTGRGGEQVYVNASTGNLVIQQVQDELAAAGIDVDSVLTYNSQGLLNDDNGDGFSLGKVATQLKLTGTANTAGSTLVRTEFDGAQEVFTWDAAHGRYVCANGAGAFDTITLSGSTWTWVDGSTQAKETYDGATWRLLTRTDAAGNALTFGYDANGQLNKVTDADGEVVNYVYSGSLLTQVTAPVTTLSGGTPATATEPVVRYAYDTSNRLVSITVDLTPADGSVADNNVYTTTFTYDGTSRRVQTMSQTDGTKLTFAYDAQQRVQTITDAAGTVTTFGYDTANHRTTQTVNGQTTTYGWDAATGLLTSVTGPASSTPMASYTYTALGQLATATDGDGNVTTYSYDANGNCVLAMDEAGRAVSRQYDAQNRLVSETTGSVVSSGPLTLVATSNVTVAGNTVTKASSNLNWDGSVYSTSGLTGPAYVSFTAGNPASHVMVGLNTDPATDANHTSIDYAVYMNAGSLELWGSGSRIAVVGTYSVGDQLGLAYDGAGTLSLIKNGAVAYAMTAPIAGTLYLDSSFYEVSSSVSGLTFSSALPAALAGKTISLPPLVSSSGMTVSGNTVTKTGSANSWYESVYSASGLSGPAYTSFIAGDATSHVMIGLNTDPATDPIYSSIDYAVYMNGGSLELFNNGNRVAIVGSYVAGDQLGLAYDGSGKISVLKNGSVIYSMAAIVTKPLYLDSSFFDVSSSVHGLTFTAALPAGVTGALASNPPVLLGTSNMIVNGGTVTASSSVQAWGGSVYSASAFSGPAYVSFIAGDATNTTMVGLNTDPTTDASYASIDYAIYMNAGSLELWSNGSRVAIVGSYVAGDQLGLAYDGAGTLSLVKNGAVVYMKAVTVTQPLYLDSSFNNPSAVVRGLSLTAALPLSQTTRYVYSADGKGLLRYTISPAGRVTEYAYDAHGALASSNVYAAATYATAGLASTSVPTEAQMNTWRASQDLTQTQRTDYTRDVREQLVTATTYSGTHTDGTGVSTAAMVVHYAYDASGRLLQQIQPGSATTTYVYDGLGRTTSSTDALNRTTLTTYADGAAGHTVTTLAPNGVSVVQTFDAVGDLLSSAASSGAKPLGTSTYSYDALGRLLRTVDPTGAATWSLYDADGRKVADIDADGILTEYVYDAASRVTQTLTYATPVSTALLVDTNGKPSNPSLASVRPSGAARKAWTVYDGAGRVLQRIDGAGDVTQLAYDGAGRVVATTRYASKVDVSTLGSAPAAVSVPASASDQTVRDYYDADGLLVGTLDGDGYLTEYQYDAAGRRAVTIRYATASTATAPATLAQARPAANAADQRSVTLYDMEGRVTGQVDPLGYLTETAYTARSQVDHVTRYATNVGTAVAAGTAIAVVRPAATAQDRTTAYTYDVDDRLQTTTDPAGAVTTLANDTLTDEVLATTIATNTPAASTKQKRYDELGRVVATLDGAASVLITTGMTTAQVNAIWSQYGTTYTYDADGRVTSQRDALGDTTLRYYDAAGQLRYTVDPTKHVVEQRYDAYGHVTATIAYANAIDTSAIGTGGAVSTALMNAVATAANAAADIVTRRLYNDAGQLVLSVDGTGAATQYTYDGAGNLTQTRQLANRLPQDAVLHVNYVPNTNSGTAMALGTFALGDVVTATVRFRATPDGSRAVGGRIYVGDGGTNGTYSPQTQATGQWQTITTSFSVTSATADKMLYVLVYGNRDGSPAPGDYIDYDDLTVTSQQKGAVYNTGFDTVTNGSAVDQWRNDPSNDYQAFYAATAADTDAQLLALANSLQDNTRDRVTRAVYDADGRKTLDVDPTGAATQYTYDAAGNVTQTRQLTTLLPSGTAMQVNCDSVNSSASRAMGSFAANDLVTATILFKAAIGSQGRMYVGTGDATGHWVAVAGTGGWQSITVTYQVGASAQNLGVWLYGSTTSGTSATYASLHVTSTLRGAVLDDSFNNDLAQWNPSTAGVASIVQIGAQDAGTGAVLAASAVALQSASDRITRSVYDAGGRKVLEVDPTDAGTQYTYDAAGNVTQVRQLATRVPANSALKVGVDKVNSSVSRSLGAFAGGDTVTATVAFKAAAGARGTMYIGIGDGTGHAVGVTGNGDWQTITVTYTAAAGGQTLGVWLYGDASNSQAVTYDNLHIASALRGTVLDDTFDNDAIGQWSGSTPAVASIVDAASDAQLLALANSVQDNAHDRITRSVYDADGRKVLDVDPTGAATQYTYDAAGNVTQTRQLATRIPANSALKVGVDSVNSAAVRALGSFAGGEMVTVTVAFKAAAGVWASIYLGIGDNTGHSAGATGNGTWQTLTVTYTVPTGGQALSLGLYGDHVTGQAVTYDDVRVTGTQRGTVLDDTFDNDAIGQWSLSTAGVASIVAASLVDAGTDAQLLALANSLQDNSRDLVTRAVYDADGRRALDVDATGAATQYTYDAAGHVTQTRQLVATVPSGAAMSVNYLTQYGDTAGTNIGMFNAGDVITATVRYKGPPSQAGKLYIGDGVGNEGDVSAIVNSAGGWTTLTVTHTVVSATTPMRVYMSAATMGGGTCYFDNLVVRVNRGGTQSSVLDTSFDSVAQWYGVGKQAFLTNADAGTDTQLLAFVNSVADSGHDRITRSVFDADGRKTLDVDPTGAATQYTYDAAGNLTQTRQLANTVPSGGALQVVYTSGNNVSQTLLGNFHVGDVLTATVRFKAPVGQYGELYVTDGGSGGTASGWIAGNGTWETITVTQTVAVDNAPIRLYLKAVNPGTALYDNVAVTSQQQGLVFSTSFDNIQVGGGIGQWSTSATTQQAAVTSIDAGTDAQLLALVSSLQDNAHDRVVTRQFDADGRVVASTGPLPGAVTRTVYDTLGRPIYAVGPDGEITQTTYDADGRVLTSTTYANKATPAQLATLPMAATAAQVAALVVASAGHDALVANQYDALGRLRFRMDGNGAVSEWRYDADGNVTEQIGYANAIPLSSWSATSAPPVVADAARDRHVRSTYDAFGNVRSQVDGRGALTAFTYDADGRVVERIGYANLVSLPSWPAPAITPDAARDAHDRIAYDAFGRAVAQSDGAGNVTLTQYDADGRVLQRTQLATTVAAGTPAAALAATARSSSDRTERFAYDAWGNPTWHVDGAGSADRTVYDANGRAVQQIRYATPITGALPGATAMIAPGANDRVTSTGYTAFGQVAWTTDGLNRLTTNAYNQDGTLASTTRYATPQPGGGAIVTSAQDEPTSYAYDLGGHITRSTDAMGGVRQYTYDGLGDRLSVVDERNQTWNYTFDAQGRQLTQMAPPVDVVANAANLGSGDVSTATSTGVRVVTATAYDALGQVRSTVVGQGLSDQRTTTYDYDAAGNQVSVTQPSMAVYDAHGNVQQTTTPVSRRMYDAFGRVVATIDPASHVAVTAYDQVGRTLYTVDGVGNASGSVYDAFGDVVTATRYWNQVPSVTASVPASAAAVATAAAIATDLLGGDHNDDRITNFTYDGAGRVLSQTKVMSAGGTFYGYDSSGNDLYAVGTTPRTTYAYDAFGDLASTGVLANTAANYYLTTSFGYDLAGQQAGKVDPLGYVTATAYDAFGNVKSTTEYATKMSTAVLGANPSYSTSPYDRTTTTVYDRLNRKTSQTLNLQYQKTWNSGPTTGATTSWTYDAQGHVTSTTDANGGITYDEYDALGRLRAEIAPTRSSTVGGAALTPVVEYDYDAYGERSTVTERATTAVAANGGFAFTGVWTRGGANGYTVAADGANDRVTRTAYDTLGRVVQVDDPLAASTSNGHNTWTVYGLDGQVARTWHLNGALTVYTGYVHDAAGQTVQVFTPSTDSSQAAHDISTEYHYDPFGDVVFQGINGGQQQFWFYNAAGQVWKSNATDGTIHVYLHDLQGDVTADLTTGGSGNPGGDVDLSGVNSEAQTFAMASRLRVVSTQYDEVGNAVAVAQATRVLSDGSTATPIVHQTFDRWGNLLTRTDARNSAWVTTYTYDAFNRVTSEIQPNSSGSPVTSYRGYDALGHLVSMVDGDSHCTGYDYDAGGNLVTTHDADGGQVVDRYDAFGRKVQEVAADAGFAGASGTAADYTTVFGYDLVGDLLSVQHGAGAGSVVEYGVNAYGDVVALNGGSKVNPTDTFTYDADGNRASSFNGIATTTYQYDAADHLVKITEPIGAEETTNATVLYNYDDFGHEKSQTDENGRTATWSYDYFGKRLSAHTDFGGTTYSYSYDGAGQLQHQTSTGGQTGGGQNQTFTYDAAGQVVGIADAGAATTTTYGYDIDGDRVREATSTTGAGARTVQNNVIAFDSLGRITSVTDANVTQTYAYDNAGNRIEAKSTTTLNGLLATGGSATTLVTDDWFGYDAMNRQVDVDWQSASIAGTRGHTLTYDYDGNRLTDSFTGSAPTVANMPGTNGTDAFGDPLYYPSTAKFTAAPNSAIIERYTYDALDRLSKSYLKANGYEMFYDLKLYDAAGRAVMEGPGASTVPGWASYTSPVVDGTPWTSAKPAGVDASTRVNVDDALGRLIQQVVTPYDPAATTDTTTTYYHYDAAGNEKTVVVDSDVNKDVVLGPDSDEQEEIYTSTKKTFSFVAGETYLQNSESDDQETRTTFPDDPTYNAKKASAHGTIETLATHFDPNGHATGTTVISDISETENQSGGVTGANNIVAPNTDTLSIVNDANGQVLSEIYGVSGNSQQEVRNLIANGNDFGQYGDALSIGLEAVYAFGYKSMRDNASSPSVGSYTVRTGDTLQSIAAAVYGDSGQWTRIAQANGLQSNRDLRVGQTISTPSTSGTLTTGSTQNPNAIVASMLSINLPTPTFHGWRGQPKITKRAFGGGDPPGVDSVMSGLMAQMAWSNALDFSMSYDEVNGMDLASDQAAPAPPPAMPVSINLSLPHSNDTNINSIGDLSGGRNDSMDVPGAFGSVTMSDGTSRSFEADNLSTATLAAVTPQDVANITSGWDDSLGDNLIGQNQSPRGARGADVGQLTGTNLSGDLQGHKQVVEVNQPDIGRTDTIFGSRNYSASLTHYPNNTFSSRIDSGYSLTGPDGYPVMGAGQTMVGSSEITFVFGNPATSGQIEAASLIAAEAAASAAFDNGADDQIEGISAIPDGSNGFATAGVVALNGAVMAGRGSVRGAVSTGGAVADSTAAAGAGEFGSTMAEALVEAGIFIAGMAVPANVFQSDRSITALDAEQSLRFSKPIGSELGNIEYSPDAGQNWTPILVPGQLTLEQAQQVADARVSTVVDPDWVRSSLLAQTPITTVGDARPLVADPIPPFIEGYGDSDFNPNDYRVPPYVLGPPPSMEDLVETIPWVDVETRPEQLIPPNIAWPTTTPPYAPTPRTWKDMVMLSAGSRGFGNVEGAGIGGPTRRMPSPGDAQFPTANDALAEALARHGIDPGTIEVTQMYGKNPNLIGPNGEPWEMIQGLNSDGEIVSFQHHASGHFFDDVNQFELPHYHGPSGEHLTYPGGPY